MKTDLGHINQVVCVTVQLTGDKPLYNYITMKFSKGEISFGKANKRLNSVEELVKETSYRHPVLLHFSGRGILNRKIRREENYRHAILLNAHLDDFYFSDYLDEKMAWCSVIRKNLVDPILAEFSKCKLSVIGISSGPFTSIPLAPFLDKATFFVDDVQVLTEKENLVGFERVDNPAGSVTIGADRIDNDQLGAVALGALFFNPSEKIILSNEAPVFRTNLEDAKQKNIFFRFGKIMMIFFLVILSANYFYLGHLNKKIETNYVILSEFEDQLAMLTTLQEEQERKENLLRSSGLLNKEFLSYYLMELSHSVPQDISFEVLQLRPLVNDIKQKQKIEFNNQLILLQGQSKTSDILSDWIEKLKQKEWISKVDIIDYTYLKNVGNFKLEIIVK